MKYTPAFVCIILSVVLGGCSQHVQESEPIKQLFSRHQAAGVFALYDVQSNAFTLHNFAAYRDSTYSSFAVSHLLIGLIGVEIGTINTETTRLPLKQKPDNLRDAIRQNADPFFTYVLAHTDTARLRSFIDSVHFGQYPTQATPLEILRTTRLTDDQLLGFTQKLYAGSLPFQPRTQNIAIALFEQKASTFGDLSYLDIQDKTFGITIGWVEVRKRPYFFILRSVNHPRAHPLDKAGRLRLLEDILSALRLFTHGDEQKKT